MLAKAIANLHEQGEEKEFYQPVHTYVLNPKAIMMEELYGGINKLTLEWHDGLMGLTVRHCVQVIISLCYDLNYLPCRSYCLREID